MGRTKGQRESQTVQRTNIVAHWLCNEGNKPGVVVERCVKEFGIQERMAWKYIKIAREEVIPSWFSWGDLRKLAKEGAARLMCIYSAAIAQNRLAEAIKALDKAHELMGITAPMQVARMRQEGAEKLMKAAQANSDEQTGKEKDAGPRSLPLEAFNESLSVYGVPSWPDEKWLQLQQGNKKDN